MRFFQINKRGDSGLTDFISILVFFVVLLIFFFLAKYLTGGKSFDIKGQSENFASRISLISILRTPLTIDGVEMDFAQLIDISQEDSGKKQILEQKIVKVLDDNLGASKCHILCIDNEKIRGSGCSSQQYFACNYNIITIPTQYRKTIQVALKSDVIEPLYQNKPLK